MSLAVSCRHVTQIDIESSRLLDIDNTYYGKLLSPSSEEQVNNQMYKLENSFSIFVVELCDSIPVTDYFILS